VDNEIFTKTEENFHAKKLEGGPKKGGGVRQVPRSPPLKHTNAYCKPQAKALSEGKLMCAYFRSEQNHHYRSKQNL